MNCEIGRLPTVIPETLVVIAQSKIYRDVAVDFNVEKRLSFNSDPRDEELTWKRHENRNRWIEYCFIAKDSFGKIILDSHLSIEKEEPEDHLILF